MPRASLPNSYPLYLRIRALSHFASYLHVLRPVARRDEYQLLAAAALASALCSRTGSETSTALATATALAALQPAARIAAALAALTTARASRHLY